MKYIKTQINRFDGGVVNPSTNAKNNTARMITNFDALTDNGRLIPYRDLESGDSAASTSKKQAFALGIRTAATGSTAAIWALFAVGYKSGDTTGEFKYKNLTGTGTLDLGDDTWTNLTNYQLTGTPNPNCFVFYPKTGLFYGIQDNGKNGIWQYIYTYNPTGSGAIVDGSKDLTSLVNCSQGLVHSKDDKLYIGIDNKIISKDGASDWNTSALTLPTGLYITSLAEYGNYIAIACAPLSGVGSSKVFIWDRDSTLATLSDSIDWGEGVLKVLEEVDGVLIGISYVDGTIGSFDDKLIFRYLNVSNAVKFKEIIAGTSSISLPIWKQKYNGRLYFSTGAITIGGVARRGLWSIGRTPLGEWSLIHERSLSNDDSALTIVSIKGFIIVNNFTFVSYTHSASTTWVLNKTNDAVSYTASSIYESNVFNSGTPNKKQLRGITVYHEALPTDGQVVVKYRIDEHCDTSDAWNTIKTNSTDDSVSFSATHNSVGGNLPQYKEIQFRIESTGGATITGLEFEEEELQTKPY